MSQGETVVWESHVIRGRELCSGGHGYPLHTSLLSQGLGIRSGLGALRDRKV